MYCAAVFRHTDFGHRTDRSTELKYKEGITSTSFNRVRALYMSYYQLTIPNFAEYIKIQLN